MTSLLSRIDEIEARAKAAAPGPWRLFNRNGVIAVTLERDHRTDVVHWSGFDASSFPRHNTANAAFIAHARTDIEDLCRILRAATTAIETFKEYSLWEEDCECSGCKACNVALTAFRNACSPEEGK